MQHHWILRAGCLLALFALTWISTTQAQERRPVPQEQPQSTQQQRPSADGRTPVLAALDGSYEIFADELPYLVRIPDTRGGLTMISVEGVTTNASANSGDPWNTKSLLHIGVGNAITGVGWDVTIEAFSPSWLSESRFTLAGWASGLGFTPGLNHNSAGTQSFASSGIIPLPGNGIQAYDEGYVLIEWYDNFNDPSVTPDAQWFDGPGGDLPPGIRLECIDQAACDAAVLAGLQGVPVISVNPASFNFAVGMNGTDSSTGTITNTNAPNHLFNTASLDWEINYITYSGIDEALNLGTLPPVTTPNTHTVYTDGGIATQGDVIGFTFQGTVALSGGAFPSDTRLIITSPGGATFSVGGYPPGTVENRWDFDWSSSPGAYTSTHLGIFDEISDDGEWTFEFQQGWGTATWSDVTITLHKSCGGSCTFSEWLTAIPSSGTIPANTTGNLELSVDASGLGFGDHAAILIMHSSAPTEAQFFLNTRPNHQILLPVSLTVIPDPPIASVNPEFFDVTAVVDEPDVTRTLTISNTGEDDLVFSMGQSFDADRPQQHPVPQELFTYEKHGIEYTYSNRALELPLAPGRAFTNGVISFEEDEGFELGFIGGQQGWLVYANNTLQPAISSANSTDGDWSLELARHTGLNNGTAVGAATPGILYDDDLIRISFDVWVSNIGGADYVVLIQTQSLVTAGVRFDWNGNIQVWNGSSFSNVSQFVTSAWRTLEIEINRPEGTIDYYYDGTLIHAGAVFAGDFIEQVLLYHDNFQLDDEQGFIDNIRIETENPWLAFEPASGIVPSGQSVDVELLFDTGIDPGSYSVNVVVLTNDPENEVITVPVSYTLLAEGGSYTHSIGNEGEGPGWRMLSSPMQGATIQHLADANLVYGLPGEHPNTDGINPLIGYDGAGFVEPTAVSQSLTPGKGFIWYLWDTAHPEGYKPPSGGGGSSENAHLPFSVTFIGSPIVESHQVQFDTRAETDDGWYLIGNPYTAPFDVSGISASSGSHSVIYQHWDPVAGASGEYVPLNGLSNAEAGIATGFFIFFGAQPTLPVTITFTTAPEEHRLPEWFSAGFELSGELLVEYNGDQIPVEVSDGNAQVMFSETGTDGFDMYDAGKLTPLSYYWANIALMGMQGDEMVRRSVESRPLPLEPVTIPMALSTFASGLDAGGTFTISLTDNELGEGWQVALVDLETGELVNLLTGSHTFTIEAQPAIDDDERFEIVFVPPTVSGDDGGETWVFGLEPVWPNPTNTTAQVDFTLETASEISLDVFDVLGRRVAWVANGEYGAGRHVLPMNTQSLASGVYVVRLIAGSQVAVQRVTVAR